MNPNLNYRNSIFPDPLLVLIEYVPFGDLLGYLRKSRGLNDTYFKDPDIKPQTSLTSQQLIKFAWQIADGMSYLSSRFVRNSCFIAILLHNLEYCFEIKIILYPWQQIIVLRLMVSSNGILFHDVIHANVFLRK